MSCFNDMKCRMRGQEAEAFAEDSSMRSDLLGSLFMGDGDCYSQGGEYYSHEGASIDDCAATCMASGQLWMTLAPSDGYCYCEYEDESEGGCESHSDTDYYVMYKSF